MPYRLFERQLKITYPSVWALWNVEKKTKVVERRGLAFQGGAVARAHTHTHCRVLEMEGMFGQTYLQFWNPITLTLHERPKLPIRCVQLNKKIGALKFPGASPTFDKTKPFETNVARLLPVRHHLYAASTWPAAKKSRKIVYARPIWRIHLQVLKSGYLADPRSNSQGTPIKIWLRAIEEANLVIDFN